MNLTRVGPRLLVIVPVMVFGVVFYRMKDRPRDSAPIPLAGPAPRVIDVTATNYAFASPDTIEAGNVTFRFANHGQEWHHLVLVALPEGKGIGDIVSGTVGEEFPTWMKPVGGPNALDPGAQGETTVSLTPGHYAMICVISSADKVMHMKKGMAREFVVTPSPAVAELPAGDLHLTLADYSFTMSGAVTVGHHEIRVSNTAQQPHEVVVVKLAPGKHMSDLMAWFGKPDGPPPGGPVGGVSPMVPGVENVVSMDFTPGNYGFICFLPDPKDHAPHVAHGMMQEFVVN